MRFILYVLSGLTMLAIAGLAGLFLVVQHYAHDLPDYTGLANYQPKISTRVQAADGHLLAEFATEKRVFVPFDAIPKRVINAFLAAEDKDFFQHGGIDPIRMAKAAVEDLKNLHSDKRPMGASTITQQVAKNFLLTNEVSISRKIKEAILAFRLEQTYSKQHILELYLNQIYLGQGTYGVAAAALNYFDKPLDELTVAEAAFLGALPKAPNNFNPDRKSDAALERRNWVIGRMREDGFIDAADEEQALAQPLDIHHQHETEFVNANYFTEEVRRELETMYGDDGLYGGGYSVRTSLDPHLQGIVVKALRDGLVSYDQRHGWRGVLGHMAPGGDVKKRLAAVPLPDGAEGWQVALVADAGRDAELEFADGSKGVLEPAGFAWTHKEKASALMSAGDLVLVENAPVEAEVPKKLKKGEKAAEAKPPELHYVLHQMPAVSGAVVAMDPHTGRVLSMSGGLSQGASEFNRATQAYRQPGSSFKPFVYLTALEKGFTPVTIVDDAPITLSQGPGLPLWQPVNYEHDFLGPQPLRVGIEKSRNAMTVRVAEYIGMPAIVETAEKFGIMDQMPANESLALGAGETTLLRMVTGYSMIVNGGKRITPALIDKVQDRDGKTVYRHDTRDCPQCSNISWEGQPTPLPPDNREQVEDPRTAFQMVTIMEGVIARGTGHRLAALGRPLAGKTGTTNDSKDVWFIGFTPDLAVGVFVGFDQPKTLGGHETGATTALPIFESVMKNELGDSPGVPFRIPPGVRMLRTNPATGEPDFGDPAGIMEAFIPGNEPGEDNFVVNGATLAAKLGERGETVIQPVGDTDQPEGADDDSTTPGTDPIGDMIEHGDAPVRGAAAVAPHAPVDTSGTGGLY
jgi:penicillin-binding protein 1A